MSGAHSLELEHVEPGEGSIWELGARSVARREIGVEVVLENAGVQSSEASHEKSRGAENRLVVASARVYNDVLAPFWKPRHPALVRMVRHDLLHSNGPEYTSVLSCLMCTDAQCNRTVQKACSGYFILTSA